MDEPATGWYFSTMGTRRRAPGRPRRVEFHRTKYGRELLVDAAFLRRLPNFDFSDAPCVLAFHDLLLVTRGHGTFELDGQAYPVAPGTMLFTRPGEVRRLRVPDLDGACLFFTEAFVQEAFADPFFLDRFAYLRAERPSAALGLTVGERRRFLERFRAMEAEVAALAWDASDALRALVYAQLVALNRAYVARYGDSTAEPESVPARFRRLVERDFARQHGPQAYARALGLSPGHLSVLCRRQFGLSAGAVIRERICLEARRLLLYTDLTAAQVAERLGFEDPSYFARFLRRETGQAPSGLRAGMRQYKT